MGNMIAALVAALAVAAGGLLGSSSGGESSTPRTALVVDASVARDGRELVDARLAATGAEVRLPRTAEEARTNLRYLAAQDYEIVVSGRLAAEAAGATGVDAHRTAGLAEALAASRR
jgi:hypothetical protein